jgi:hypothetical protein
MLFLCVTRTRRRLRYLIVSSGADDTLSVPSLEFTHRPFDCISALVHVEARASGKSFVLRSGTRPFGSYVYTLRRLRVGP